MAFLILLSEISGVIVDWSLFLAVLVVFFIVLKMLLVLRYLGLLY